MSKFKSNVKIIDDMRIKAIGDIYKTKTVGDFLYVLRESNDLTTTQFAKKIKLSRSMSNSLEINNQELKHKYVKQIADAFMLSDPELLHLLELVNKQPNKGLTVRRLSV